MLLKSRVIFSQNMQVVVHEIISLKLQQKIDIYCTTFAANKRPTRVFFSFFYKEEMKSPEVNGPQKRKKRQI